MKNLPTNIMNKCTSYYPPVFVELWWYLLFHLETTEVFPPNASWPVFQVLWSVNKWKVNKFVRLIYKNWLKLPCDFTKYLRFLHKPHKGSLMYLQCKLSWITRLSITHKIYKSHLHLQVPETVTHQHWKPLPLREDKDYECMNLLLCTFSNHLVIKPGHHQSQHDSRVCQVTPTSNNQGNETLL